LCSRVHLLLPPGHFHEDEPQVMQCLSTTKKTMYTQADPENRFWGMSNVEGEVCGAGFTP